MSMKSERKIRNLESQIMEIETKERKLRYRKDVLKAQLSKEVDKREQEKHVMQAQYAVPPIGRVSDADEVIAQGIPESRDRGLALAVAHCLDKGWTIEYDYLVNLAEMFPSKSPIQWLELLAQEAPFQLSVKPPVGKSFSTTSSVFQIPKLRVLQ